MSASSASCSTSATVISTCTLGSTAVINTPDRKSVVFKSSKSLILHASEDLTWLSAELCNLVHTDRQTEDTPLIKKTGVARFNRFTCLYNQHYLQKPRNHDTTVPQIHLLAYRCDLSNTTLQQSAMLSTPQSTAGQLIGHFLPDTWVLMCCLRQRSQNVPLHLL